ncbi:MAG: SRPBCC family protein [Steroidobacteraceae bacterium]|jgi:carbon monoxide dehydrogenase subunit G|nr:SRPBCC family protein [Steroidobacteraceae bacterium]
MAIDIQETFTVAAPISKVWEFMMTPNNVVACMPGASLTEIIDAGRFVGAVKIKIGAVTAQYQGSITYEEIDPEKHTMQLLVAGIERGGGGVNGAISTQLTELADGRGVEVRCKSSVDLTGRMAQVGRGMIEGVAAQIIKKYVANVRTMLEDANRPDVANGRPARVAAPQGRMQRQDSINILALVFKVLWDGLRSLLRRPA